MPGEERHEGSDDGGEQVRRAGEIAQPSGEVFTERGWDAVVVPPEQVQGIDSFDAVVLGSAVYAGHWLKPARELVDRSREALAARPVWVFSSGPIGNPPKPEEDPVDIADIMQATKAPGHRVFAGKLVKKQLSFPDRAMAAALPVPKAISGTGRRSRPGRQRSPMPSGPDPDRSGPAAALLSAGQDPVAASGHDGVISRTTGVPRGRRRCSVA